MTFIVINKIVSDHKKDYQGKTVKEPMSNRPILNGSKVVRESILVEEVKSSREFHDPKKYNENGVDGPVTILYMKGKSKSEGGKAPEIHINEHIDSWNKRTGAIEIAE